MFSIGAGGIFALLIQLAFFGLVFWAMLVFHKKNKAEIRVIRKRLGLGQDLDARGGK
ncbi:hypothetical protein [Rothia sp. CCM 9416]|uniref:hypothetical protein n=1 Tax=Rothia sp. CCM 9416 TaxID=3402655 RepID=UPI003AE0B32A